MNTMRREGKKTATDMEMVNDVMERSFWERECIITHPTISNIADDYPALRLTDQNEKWSLRRMSAALGAPTFVPLHKRSSKPVIQYKSQRWPNAVLEFYYKGANPRDPCVEYYRCISCYKLSKQASSEKCRVAHLTLRNGVMATDPDHPATPHSCNPNEDADAASVLSRRFMSKSLRTCARAGKDPERLLMKQCHQSMSAFMSTKAMFKETYKPT
ncbi:hypothetical protein HPB47_023501 [Ixodes persulcatus]|uniref:Uncharacterized protein n=1 Tax=Ixodes persulcatus TaxID=34615 RepID=A0AC60R2H1_IXOPE|nr:hypothetical protein HPB47_023501 [Ixodes persulcatus]